MRKLVYYIAVTLDGFIAAPDGTYDCFATEGDHLEAIVTELPETLPVHVRAALGIDAPPARFDTVVMGRATLQPALDIGITSPYPHLRQYVLSHTLPAATDATEPIVGRNPIDLIRELKAEDSDADVWLCGVCGTAYDADHDVKLELEDYVSRIMLPKTIGHVTTFPVPTRQSTTFRGQCSQRQNDTSHRVWARNKPRKHNQGKS